jgi:protein-S-isoprenylcysteine O-methyltransferase Ste14
MATIEENIAADRARETTARAEFGATAFFVFIAILFLLATVICSIIFSFNGWSILGICACATAFILAGRTGK